MSTPLPLQLEELYISLSTGFLRNPISNQSHGLDYNGCEIQTMQWLLLSSLSVEACPLRQKDQKYNAWRTFDTSIDT